MAAKQDEHHDQMIWQEAHNQCPFCKKILVPSPSSPYFVCKACQHQLSPTPSTQEFIINENLSTVSPDHPPLLERAKIKLTQEVAGKSANDRRIMVDIGSASGLLLYFMRERFTEVFGIEVSPECLAYSRKVLKLKVDPTPPQLSQPASMITSWHAFEHIPVPDLNLIMNWIDSVAADATQIIISVPNGRSLQYRMLGRHYAYYDFPNHIHQFSPKSLNLLFKRIGFEPERYYHSLPYSAFGALQGLLNLFNKHHNYFYYRRKRGWTFSLSRGALWVLDAYNVLLILALALPAAAVTAMDFMSRRHASVLTVNFHKPKTSDA